MIANAQAEVCRPVEPCSVDCASERRGNLTIPGVVRARQKLWLFRAGVPSCVAGLVFPPVVAGVWQMGASPLDRYALQESCESMYCGAPRVASRILTGYRCWREERWRGRLF